ncbi:hypothetical protein RHMOL_Rhmol07G0246100 [Rhododendron molle]|uniref:Uncharacterized protein n=1 Tax=Rhododendron molle TaxID=49168 RepID=A0ACC0N533_RHOML|nr:hypothetical protein RHMOL_Rhmol07G0246100 [Rhododendron molle]
MGMKEDEERRLDGGVVVVNPKPKKGLTSKAVDWLEKLIVKLMYDSSQPHHYLSGNFAPCEWIFHLPNGGWEPVNWRVGVAGNPSALGVAQLCWGGIAAVALWRQCSGPAFLALWGDRSDNLWRSRGFGNGWTLGAAGRCLECLDGEFVRVGPNPKFAPVAGYHCMIHGLRIKEGKATYVSRYVKTSRLKQEEFFGGSKFMKIGDLKGLFGLLMVNMQMLRAKLKVLDVSYGYGTDVVKVLEDGDLQTLGMLDYDKRLAHSFTAHPKVDPFTGEMFTFGYSHAPPYITYRVISKDGFMQDPVPITIPEPIMMHDFAITENYAIIMDLPLYFRPKEMVKDKKLIFTFDSTKKARFGVLPRYAKDELLIKWFNLPNCFIFHNANAWEEGDEVVLITCRLQNPDLDMVSGTVKEKLENFSNELYEMRFNMKTGLASQKKLSASAVDFPRVNESYTGRKQRFVYGTMLDSIAKVTGIIKFDLHAEPDSEKTKLEVGGNVQGIFDLGPGRFGSEAIFVPREPGITSEEDDGYLIFFVHDEASGKSAVNVIDAKTMSADPVAVVELPHRVPYGFHAFFVTEEQLQEQAKL